MCLNNADELLPDNNSVPSLKPVLVILTAVRTSNPRCLKRKRKSEIKLSGFPPPGKTILAAPMAKLVALFLHIREIPSSILGQVIGYPD
jgi:hypothetical protein